MNVPPSPTEAFASIRIDPRAPIPIWRQIEEALRRLLASGSLPPGSPIPSVRKLAKDLQVNPATVARAYRPLVAAGLLTVRPGRHTSVSRSCTHSIRQLRRQALAESALHYASIAVTLGASLDEAIRAFEVTFSRLRSSGAPQKQNHSASPPVPPVGARTRSR